MATCADPATPAAYFSVAPSATPGPASMPTHPKALP
jgi:hypothetical protein